MLTVMDTAAIALFFLGTIFGYLVGRYQGETR